MTTRGSGWRVALAVSLTLTAKGAVKIMGGDILGVGDHVEGDPGTTQRERGSVLEVDVSMRRYLVQWESGLATWHEQDELTPVEAVENKPTT